MTSNVNVPFSNLRAVVILIVVTYGIYLVHYVFVLWLGYALVGKTLSAPAKMLVVFSAALVPSWLTSAGAGAIVGTMARTPSRRPSAISHEGVVADRT